MRPPSLCTALLLATASLAAADPATHADEDDFALEVAKLLPAPKFPRAAPANPALSNQNGQWSSVIAWTPHIPVSAANLPDGRILTFASNQRTSFPAAAEFTYAATWNPATGQFQEFNHPSHDMFCGALVQLADGRVMVAGGRNNTVRNSVFDWRTNTWTRLPDMNGGRWYNTAVALGNGNVFTVTGSGTGQNTAERWTGSAWSLLTGINWSGVVAEPGYATNWHPFLNLAPDGRLAHFGPSDTMRWITPTGTGSMVNTGTTVPGTHYPKEGCWTMYDEGRLLVAGGGATTTRNPSDSTTGTSTNAAYTVDIRSNLPVVATTASMANARQFANCVVLPSGEVLVMGGNTSGLKFNDTGSVFPCEIWNPRTGTWRTVASISVARNYHSVALLLPDGRVWLGGGGLGGADHRDAQIYTPPGLFTTGGAAAVRPVLNTAPASITAGSTFQVNASTDIVQFAFIKMSSITHSVNTDLRRIVLPYTETTAGNYQLTAHSSLNVMTPGYWMLFGLNAAGAHSVSKVIRVDTAPAPVVTQPGPQATVVNTPVSLQIAAQSQAGTPVFSAAGLPAGLTINASTGRISGTPVTVANYNSSVTVNDGVNSPATVNFTWSIVAPLTLNLGGRPAVAAGTAGSVTAAASGGAAPLFRWSWGDGTADSAPSASPDAVHTWTVPGRYRVVVTASDSTGAIVTAQYYQAVHAPLTAAAPARSSSIVFEGRATGNDRVWAVNPDNDSVSVFDTVTRTRLAEIATGKTPRTVAVAPDGRVWVVNGGAATLSIISPSTLVVVSTVNLPRASKPWGLAFDPDGSDAWIACEGSGQLLRLNPSTGAQLAGLNLGLHIRHVAVNAMSSRVYVSRFITPPVAGESTASVNTSSAGGEVVAVNPSTLSIERTIRLQHSNVQDSSAGGRGLPNYLGAPAISPDGLSAWIAGKQDNIARGALRDGNQLTHDLAVRSITSRIDLSGATPATDDLAGRVDHDNAGVASATAWDPRGIYVFTAIEGSRTVAVTDAWNRRELLRFNAGRAPQGLAVSPDGRTLFVHNFMDRSVTVHDVSATLNGQENPPVQLASMSSVATEKLSSAVLQGKKLFYDSRDPRVALQEYISCAACHNDGGDDGRVWDFTGIGEGLRNTISLRGKAGTGHGPLHWTGNFDEVQDFENQIRDFAGGTGLSSVVHPPVGTPNSGTSADLDALAAYVASLSSEDPSPARNSDGSLTAAAQAGLAVFRANACAQCHSGSAYTNSALNVFRNVGTLKPSSGQRLGQPLTGLDVPTLRGLWLSPPYLHDGSAATLSAAVTAHQGINLSPADLNSLAAYLQQLDGSAPAAGVTPAVTLSAPVSVSGTFTVQAVFSAPVTGLDAADFILANGSVESLTSVNATTWTLAVTPLTPGNVVIRTLLNAAQSVEGNASLPSNILSVAYTGPSVPSATDWWKLDDTAGNSAANAAGTRNATHQNGVAINQPGARSATGGSARYDGVDDQTAIPALNYTGGSMTIALWVRREGVQRNLAQFLYASTPLTDAGLGLSSSGHGLRYVWAGTHWQFTPSPDIVVPDNQWCLAALVIQPDRGTLYLRTADGMQSAVNIAPHAQQPFEAVSYLAVDSRRPARRFKGWLDDVRLFNSALSAADIEALYVSASAGSANRAPVVVQPANQTSNRGNSVTLAVSGTDPDGDALTWSASGLPAGLGISPAGLITGTISTGAAETNNVTVSASDGDRTASASFTWTTTAPGSTVPNADDHWRFDEAAGAAAINAVRPLDGAHQNGVLVNQPGATSSTGRSAFYDGNDDVTRVTAPGYTGTGFSAVCWVQRNGVQRDWAAMLSSFGPEVDMAFSVGYDDELRYRWDGTHYQFEANPPLTLPDGQWALAALAVEGSGTTLYLRTPAGLRSARNDAVHFPQVFTSDLLIASDANRAGRNFKGGLDEVRIFRSTLSAADIEALWLNGMSGSANRVPVVSRPADQSTPRASTAGLQIQASDPDGNALSYSAAGLPAGLSINAVTGFISGTVLNTALAANNATVTVSDGSLSSSVSFAWTTTAVSGLTPPDDWWKLDEASGTAAANTVRALDGTHLGGALPGQSGATPLTGSSVYYDGADDATSIPPLVNTGTAFSMLAWVKRDGAQRTWTQLLYCRDGETDAGLAINGSHALRYVWEGGQWSFAGTPELTVPDNEWCLAALVIRPESGTLLLRTTAGLQSATNFTPHGLQPFNSPLHFAADPSRTGRNFKGWLDDVRLYRKALTLDEVEMVWLDATGGQRSNGITGTYFSGVNFDVQVMQRLDPALNFNWALSSPAAGVPADNFSVRWTGCVIPPFTQTTSFHLLASSGCRMWVRDELIIDNWTNPVSTEVTGSAVLTAGVAAPIRVEYFHTTGTARSELSWSAPGLSKQIIPQSRLMMNETTTRSLRSATSGEPDSWMPSASTLLAIEDLPWVQQSLALDAQGALRFDRRSGIPEQWRLERSTDLRSWFPVPDSGLQIQDSGDGLDHILLPASPGAAEGKTFYRVRAGQ